MKNELAQEILPPEPTLTPVAYLDDLGGRTLVVQINGMADFALLTPPLYSLEGAMRGEWVRDTALAKHGFSEFTEEQVPLTPRLF